MIGRYLSLPASNLSVKIVLIPVLDPTIERELLFLGSRNLWVHATGHTGLSLLVAAGSWLAVPHAKVLTWLGVMLALALLFLAGLWQFRQNVKAAARNERVSRQWKRVNSWLVTLAGLGWGCIGFLFVPGAPVNNLLVMTAFAGALAYSAVGNAYDFRGFVVSVCLATMLLLSQLPAAFGTQALTVSGMCLLYLLVMVWVARNAHLTLVDSIRLRLSNEILARKSAENASLAEQASRHKSEFLAAASHDLRQPVHALMLLIEAYRQQVPQAMSHPLMPHIIQAGQSINGLFNSLMELSRLESGTEKPIPSDFDLCAALREALAHLQPQARAKGLRLSHFFASGLASTWLRTDQVLFGRIVANLLGNALRYTSRGGVLLALRRSHGSGNCGDGSAVRIEVWDTGIGIAPENQGRIFDPYVQMANRERDRSKGLGLGLAIVRHACELLGLTVSVRSVVNRGTCFRLVLPQRLLVASPVDRQQVNENQSRNPDMVRAGVWLHGRRVLLVDDDPLVQLAMQALLKSWQLDVRFATRADASVLEACAPHWVPECVLCDFRLPGTMNGIELLDFLLQQFPSAIGVLLTGEMVQTVQQDAEDAGYLLLSKPLDASVLAYTLGALLERRQEERSA